MVLPTPSPSNCPDCSVTGVMCQSASGKRRTADLVFQRLLHGRLHGKLAGESLQPPHCSGAPTAAGKLKAKRVFFSSGFMPISNWSGCLLRVTARRALAVVFTAVFAAKLRSSSAKAASCSRQGVARLRKALVLFGHGIYQCACSGSRCSEATSSTDLRNIGRNAPSFWLRLVNSAVTRAKRDGFLSSRPFQFDQRFDSFRNRFSGFCLAALPAGYVRALAR